MYFHLKSLRLLLKRHSFNMSKEVKNEYVQFNISISYGFLNCSREPQSLRLCKIQRGHGNCLQLYECLPLSRKIQFAETRIND